MENSKKTKTSNSSVNSVQNSWQNPTQNNMKNKGTTSSVKPDDNERRDGPGGE